MIWGYLMRCACLAYQQELCSAALEIAIPFLGTEKGVDGNWEGLTMTRLMTMAFCMLCIFR
jgi:hypothetical protein